ncbi:MAG TPA: hypothetical protein VGG03_00830 [Thermoanaerobaculia bacterium]|jgi:hypothetical protein
MQRILVALALASSLLTSPGPRPDLLGPFRTFLSLLGSGSSTKEGCGMDPSGHCNTAPQPGPEIEAGCGMDPDGRPCS